MHRQFRGIERAGKKSVSVRVALDRNREFIKLDSEMSRPSQKGFWNAEANGIARSVHYYSKALRLGRGGAPAERVRGHSVAVRLRNCANGSGGDAPKNELLSARQQLNRMIVNLIIMPSPQTEAVKHGEEEDEEDGKEENTYETVEEAVGVNNNEIAENEEVRLRKPRPLRTR